MVLEYSGVDLALVEWASALKELLFMTVLVNLFVPLGLATGPAFLALAIACFLYVSKLFLLAVAVTIVEVTNAKLRLFRVPELMAASLGLGFLALAIRFL
jgi:formate hydrogenlyase subunit 4